MAKSKRKPTPAFHLFPEITHVKKRAFLTAFVRCGSRQQAATLAGMDDRIHWYWLKHDERYKAAFAEAEQMAGDRAEDRLYELALQGTKRGIYHQGIKIDEEEVVYPTLLLAVVNAARPDKYQYRQSTEHTISPALAELQKQWQTLRDAPQEPRALPPPENVPEAALDERPPEPRPWPTWPPRATGGPLTERQVFASLDALNDVTDVPDPNQAPDEADWDGSDDPEVETDVR